MHTNDVIENVLRSLYLICAKLRSIKSYNEEFYDRINLKDPVLVAQVEEEMGTEKEKE